MIKKVIRTIFLAVIFTTGFSVPAQTGKTILSLRVNGYQEVQITRGYPVIISITLQMIQDQSWARLIEQMPDSLKSSQEVQRVIDSIAKAHERTGVARWPERVFVMATSGNASYPLLLDKVMLRPYSDTMSFIPGQTGFIDYGIDPEYTSKWKEGKISLVAGYLADEDKDTVWAEPAFVTVKGSIPRKIQKLTDHQVQFIARYQIRRGKCETALKYALELNKRYPANVGYSTLLGDVYVCANEPEKALEEYRKALILFELLAAPDEFPPEYLQTTINKLQLQLTEQK